MHARGHCKISRFVHTSAEDARNLNYYLSIARSFYVLNKPFLCFYRIDIVGLILPSLCVNCLQKTSAQYYAIYIVNFIYIYIYIVIEFSHFPSLSAETPLSS